MTGQEGFGKQLKWQLLGLVTVLVVVIDQATKLAVLSSFNPGEVRPVLPGVFNLTLHFNPGAAFGLLADVSDGWRHMILGATTVLALVFVLYLLIREYLGDAFGQACLALVIGGALGNIADRVRLGEVVDFLDFYYGAWHWPAFNLADSAICVGVFLLLIRGRRKTSAAKSDKSA